MAEFFDVINGSRELALDCMEDRGLIGSEQSIKVPGSAYGLAEDLYFARFMKSPNQYSEQSPPLGEAAKIITAGLGHHALIASTHEMCAAEGELAMITQTIIERPDETLRAAKEIAQGDIPTNLYEQVTDASRRILDSSTGIFRGVMVEAACMDKSMRHEAIVRKLLANKIHLATELQVNHITNTWFDTKEAYKQNKAKYHLDFWALPQIATTIDEVLPHDNVDGFALATAIRTGAISLLMPHGTDSDKTGLDINVVAA